LIAQDVPALVYPVMHRGKPDLEGRKPQRARADWFIVQLDRDYLRDHVFPELAERYFGSTRGLAYQVAVISIGPEHAALYASDHDFGSRGMADADFAINIFGPPIAALPPHGVGLLPPPPSSKDFAGQVRTFVDERGWPEAHSVNPRPSRSTEESAAGVASAAVAGHPGGASPFIRFEPIRYDSPPSDWQLVVKNRGGSLEAVAAAIRRRNLVISFGVLLVLAATTGIILITSQRAQRLARLQMDFVAGVSHELRTPLTVISSAADNIADGVVGNQQQVVRYGKVIKTQARQLIQLVEQVLLFAAARDKGYRYHLQPLAVDDIVKAALESTAGLLSAAGVVVDKQVQPDLPRVEGDLVALSQCLQNLITNAVKYGGESRWIGLRASHNHDGRADEIRIAVSDKGVGIAPADLEHIFEPFYRSASVAAAQIHGTGLGLPLAKNIAEAMNGRLTVSSEPGKGSTFVLHLPVAGEAASREVPQAAAVGSNLS
jgi:signal transduction histidine kinase